MMTARTLTVWQRVTTMTHNHPMVRKADVADLNARYAPWRIEKVSRRVYDVNAPFTSSAPPYRHGGFDVQARNVDTGEVIYRCEGWNQAARGQALRAILERRNAR